MGGSLAILAAVARRAPEEIVPLIGTFGRRPAKLVVPLRVEYTLAHLVRQAADRMVGLAARSGDR